MSQDGASTRPYFTEQLSELERAASFHPMKTCGCFLRRRGKPSDFQEVKLSQPCSMAWVWLRRRGWESDTCRRLVDAGSAGGPLDYLEPGTVLEPEMLEGCIGQPNMHSCGERGRARCSYSLTAAHTPRPKCSLPFCKTIERQQLSARLQVEMAVVSWLTQNRLRCRIPISDFEFQIASA